MKKIILLIILITGMASCHLERPLRQVSQWMQYDPSDIYVGYFTTLSNQ